jgi:hypothetical protein
MKNIMIGLVFFSIFIILKDTNTYDSTDDVKNKVRSGMKLYIDHETGCEYIGTLFGSLRLRLDRNGKHICRSIK